MDMSKLSKVDAKSGSVDDLITFLSAINSVEKEPVVFLLNEDDYHWDFAGITHVQGSPRSTYLCRRKEVACFWMAQGA